MSELFSFESSHQLFCPIMKIIVELLANRSQTLEELGFTVDSSTWYISEEQLSYLMIKNSELL